MRKVDKSEAPSGRAPLGPVHRSHTRALGVGLWSLAAVSVIIVGRYTTLSRIERALHTSWLPFLQVAIVLSVFVVMSVTLASVLKVGRRPL